MNAVLRYGANNCLCCHCYRQGELGLVQGKFCMIIWWSVWTWVSERDIVLKEQQWFIDRATLLAAPLVFYSKWWLHSCCVDLCLLLNVGVGGALSMCEIFLTPLVYTYFGNVACRSLICYFAICLVPVQHLGAWFANSLVCGTLNGYSINMLFLHCFLSLFWIQTFFASFWSISFFTSMIFFCIQKSLDI